MPEAVHNACVKAGVTEEELAYIIPHQANARIVQAAMKNMGLPMDGPLKYYKFDPKFAGLPVCITVEIYNSANQWDVKETYQEILLLGGGKQQIGLPDWFHVPTNRLAYDFDEGDWFPSGWKLPRGKYAHWQGAAKAMQEDRKGENPMYDFGFTHVSPMR
jgi:hypothetical protein